MSEAEIPVDKIHDMIKQLFYGYSTIQKTRREVWEFIKTQKGLAERLRRAAEFGEKLPDAINLDLSMEEKEKEKDDSFGEPSEKRPRTTSPEFSGRPITPNPADEELYPDSDDEPMHDSENEDEEEDKVLVEDEDMPIFNLAYIRQKFEYFAEKFVRIQKSREERGKLVWDEKMVIRVLYLRRISRKCREAMIDLKIPIKKFHCVVENDFIQFVIFCSGKPGEELNIRYHRRSQEYLEFAYGENSGRFFNDKRETGGMLDMMYLLKKLPKPLRELKFEADKECHPTRLNYHLIFESFRRIAKSWNRYIEVEKLRIQIKGFLRSAGYDNKIMRSVLKRLKPGTLSTLEILDIRSARALHNWYMYRGFRLVWTLFLSTKDVEDVMTIFSDYPPFQGGQGFTLNTTDEIDLHLFKSVAKYHSKLIVMINAPTKNARHRLFFRAKRGHVVGISIRETSMQISVVWPKNHNTIDFPTLPPEVTGLSLNEPGPSTAGQISP
ncbi:hypothetical protein L5515_010945 [Caenorhabditis briggsae]|uniref:Uncharacterized protein n=1 Tax=Caenorhabditis briggsae TaxID=6238 RepID=A0AAE9JGL7_CAEBR|nr:hypothetical protein L5515_010945 [Caenorhabditis briggsae]